MTKRGAGERLDVRAHNFVDRAGARFGQLTVVRLHEAKVNGRAAWVCVCDCGSEAVVQANNLQSGNTQSCGHLGEGNIDQTRHGHTRGGQKTATYRTWANMIQRCADPNATSWKNYGERGIKVCRRWRVYENFFKDMGERPSGLTIDRVNNGRGYSPTNCRWATAKEQAQNRRKPRRRAG